MKVLLINGSPRHAGNTFIALSEVAGALEAEGVRTQIVQLGNKPVWGCIACALLDRVFYSCSELLAYKPAAAVVVCRRGGASAAFDRLNKYFTISNMPVVSSQYWNSVHGRLPGEAAQDAEGLQTMRVLGRNMARLLKAGPLASEARPEKEERVWTHFIR